MLRGPEDQLYDRMMQDCHRAADVGRLCETLGIDKYNISARFKEAYGETPNSFHKTARLLESAVRLLLTDDDIGAVASDYGYMKEGKFAAEFKKAFGCRPRDFKKGYLESLR